MHRVFLLFSALDQQLRLLGNGDIDGFARQRRCERCCCHMVMFSRFVFVLKVAIGASISLNTDNIASLHWFFSDQMFR